MIFSFLVSIFGLLIVLKTAKDINFVEQTSVRTNFLIQINFVIVFSTVIILFFDNSIVMASILLVIILTPVLVQHYFEYREKIKFEREFLSKLDLIILNCRTGKSLKEAIQAVMQDSDLKWRQYLYEVHQSFIYGSIQSKKNYSEAQLLAQKAFLEINNRPNKVIDQLKAYRYQVFVLKRFRQKSRKALSLIKAQSIVIAVIYIVLISFTLKIYEWNEVASFALVSALLFFSGLIWIHFFKRKYKWKT